MELTIFTFVLKGKNENKRAIGMVTGQGNTRSEMDFWFVALGQS